MKALMSLLMIFAFSTAAAAPVTINGAGATFPYPLYTKWFSEFNKADKDAQINYQSIGSGGGIRQLIDQTVDFGASDAPMSDEEMGKAKGPVIHIPTVLGAVVITYNLPNVPKDLKLDAEIIEGFYTGTITKWNDPKIVKLNPGAKLTETAVLPVYRSDGSGTTSIFTNYMAKASG
jgi:phosphate transport system substrate-binding protein